MAVSPAERRRALDAVLPAWRPRTLAQFLDDQSERFGSRLVLITERGNWSYAALRDWSLRLAERFAQLGVGPGDHVALIMANYAEFVAVKFAVARLGAAIIPVNFNLRGAELHYVLAQSEAKLLITMDRFRGYDYLNDLDAIAPGWRRGASDALPALSAAIVFETEAPLEADGRSTLDYDATRANPAPVGLATDTSDILYTSGTTGRSKGVVISHDMVLRSAWSSVYHRAFEDGRRIMHALPMYHVFGYVECLIASMWVGGAVIINLLFEPTRFLEMAEEHRATDIICLPTMTMKLLEVIPERGYDASHLICMFNSGGVNPAWIWQRIRDLIPAPEIHTAYGMSETTASATCTLPEDNDRRLLESNGRFKLSGAAGSADSGGFVAIYKVVDPATGYDLAPGTTGELVVRGPVVTRGYFKKPAETAAAYTHDGWLHTGDLGHVD
ncbi:MAG TPA: long-chain fatty acid--CoA ligase, partial [Sphingomicrobium sp.]